MKSIHVVQAAIQSEICSLIYLTQLGLYRKWTTNQQWEINLMYSIQILDLHILLMYSPCHAFGPLIMIDSTHALEDYRVLSSLSYSLKKSWLLWLDWSSSCFLYIHSIFCSMYIYDSALLYFTSLEWIKCFCWWRLFAQWTINFIYFFCSK